MPMIDVEIARIWANERWPSPVVRRCVDGLLANCPRAKAAPPIRCKDCKHSELFYKWTDGDESKLYLCMHKMENGFPRTVYHDSTCDDAEERGAENDG